ncbi:hypothetical protein [Bacillus thuringiensis]|nr:hypothetical protein [Bacillus thuringiensis]
MLIWYWLKRKKYLDQYLIEQTVPESTVSTVQLFKEYSHMRFLTL